MTRDSKQMAREVTVTQETGVIPAHLLSNPIPNYPDNLQFLSYLIGGLVGGFSLTVKLNITLSSTFWATEIRFRTGLDSSRIALKPDDLIK